MQVPVSQNFSGRQGKAIGALALVALTATLALLQWSGHSLGQHPRPQRQHGWFETLGGGVPSRRRAALEETTCTPPTVDEEKLVPYGCKLLRDSCLDQGRILLHTGEKTPGHPNWTHLPLFQFADAFPELTLPGYPEPLGTAHYMPATYNLDIRAPTPLDPPDVWQPQAFNNCTVPLIFVPHYFSIFGDFFIYRVNEFFKMSEEGVIDQSVQFVPNTNGMDAPAFYQQLLEPFSRHKVESLSSISSREHIHTGRGRCYSLLLLCNLGTHWEHKRTGRKIVDYYTQKHPDRFLHGNDSSGSIFRVAFARRSGPTRHIVNLEQVLEACRRWVLPPNTRFSGVDCSLLDDFTELNFVGSLAELQRVDALVSMHGSGMTNAFFLPPGAAVVEVLCWNFCGAWPDMYYRWGMELDQAVPTGYFRLRADQDHCFPGPYERINSGSVTAWARDQDIRVEFPILAQALARIALGDIESVEANFYTRVFNMTQDDACPPT